MLRKFLMLAAIAMLAVIPSVSAEQYRQIFRSGNFYVEYHVQTERNLNYDVFRLNTSPVLVEEVRVVSPLSFFAGKSYVVLAVKDGNRVMKSNLKDKVPQLMYRDGKYYNYLNERHLLILPEDELDSLVRDPDEGWQNIRNKLALPEGLAIFYWEDSFRDKNFDWGVPTYSGSSTKTVKKKTYDCDRYVSDIKTLAGTVIAQEIYDALYENGKLVMVQKYFVRDGNEFLITTTNVRTISAQVSDTAFDITKKLKTYAPHEGDMNDLLEVYEQTGEIGGAKK